jgi:hypothetical protein
MYTSKSLARAAGSIAVVLIVVNQAHSHPEFNPISTNRYVKLNLLGANEVRLAYTVMYGAAPAAAARKAADANADGRVDEAESRALGQALLASVQKGLSLSADGKPATLAFEPPAVGLAGAEVGPSPFSIDLVARVACPGAGPHELRYDDQTELPAIGETELRIEEAPGTTLLTAHRGPTGTERETRFLFRGPKFSALEDRSITLRFQASDAPPPTVATAHASTPRWPYALAAGVLVALLGIAGLYARRYRSMKG